MEGNNTQTFSNEEIKAVQQDSSKIGDFLNRLNWKLQLRTFLDGYTLGKEDIEHFDFLQNVSDANTRKALPHLDRYFKYLSTLPELASHIKEDPNARKSRAGAQGNFSKLELPGASMGNVVTRFPPEPSGYLHIGHAKAALLNNYFAQHYGGKLILRFDDTNPMKEKDEFVQSIMEDLVHLGIKHHQLTHTSDWFDRLQTFCEQFIKEGHAYVDTTDAQTIKDQRMVGTESPCRNQPVAVSLDLWEQMKKGTPKGLQCVVRAKIDMQEKNKCLRDPAIYRCNLTPHHKTGTKYKVYPLYDFACPIVDSLEGVTHSLRSSEYHDRNPLYNWVADTARVRRPFIQDFSRLNFTYTLLSKRKLQMFVDKNLVGGWDDPRFPTLRGLWRRGLTTEALTDFVMSQGASKSLNLMEVEKLWALNKQIIDPIIARYTAIVDDGKVTLNIEDGPSDPVLKSVPKHKKNLELGNKTVTYFKTVYLEREDAKLIKEGEEVTLMDWGNAIITKIHKDADGRVTGVDGKLHLEGSVKNTEKKLTWLPASDDLTKVIICDFDNLITKKKLDDGDNLDNFITPVTIFKTPAIGDANLRGVARGERLQLERRGYFICDEPYISSDKPIVLFNIPDGHNTKETSVLVTKANKPTAQPK
eukprot:TRINITY_DN1608_c0_g1_i1.p1 TRINITY_DN1608_c0_g1~~TRINITY_DN1608_c0_g1_i1.p1  ORF type:complete len:642 (-),score=202.82 TRINITY_DN1608_c0_g1_i1:43-1968(-)